MTDTLACHDIGSGVNTHSDGYEHTSAMTVKKQTPAPTGLHVVDPRHRSSAVWLVVEPLPGIPFACKNTHTAATHLRRLHRRHTQWRPRGHSRAYT